MQYGYGSQWRSLGMGVIWSVLPILVINLAALFCTNYKFRINLSGTPEQNRPCATYLKHLSPCLTINNGDKGSIHIYKYNWDWYFTPSMEWGSVKAFPSNSNISSDYWYNRPISLWWKNGVTWAETTISNMLGIGKITLIAGSHHSAFPSTENPV